MKNKTYSIELNANDLHFNNNISSNRKLANVLPIGEIFSTKKEATKALSDGYQTLFSEWGDRQCTQYNRGKWLRYDAATARITCSNEFE